MDTLININEEVFRAVKGYDGLYISNFGNYVPNKDLILYSKKNKYEQISYKGNLLFTHIIVAITFPEICGEWYYGYEVHHKDGNTFNNYATNLLCLTQTEHHNIHKTNPNYGARKKVICYLNGKAVKEYCSIKEFKEKEGITYWNVGEKLKTGYEYNGYLAKIA